MYQADAEEFRRAASRFTTGVTLVASRDGNDETVCMTANSFTSISLAPPTVLVSLKPGRTLNTIQATGRFAISVLPATARDLSGHFAGKPVPGLVPKFDEFEGMPRLADAVAWFDCKMVKSVEVNDHRLIIGEVQACACGEGSPLVFYSSRYHNLAA